MEKQKLTIKEKALELKLKRFLTIYGKKTIAELTEEIGLPVAIIEKAKVEAHTGLCNPNTIIVEKFVRCKLVFNDKCVIEIEKSLLTHMNFSEKRVEYVRHPKYSAEKMPKASKSDIEKNRHQS